MYITKRDKRAHSVLNIKALSTCLTRGMILENVGLKLKRLTLVLHHNKFM